MSKLSPDELLRLRSVSSLGLDPFPWYKQMRTTDPVFLDEENQVCDLFRYKDVQSVLDDPELFSSKPQRDGERRSRRGSISLMDPPRHKKLRSLVSQAFTPRTIAQQADNIRGIVNELLDAATASGTIEIIGDFAVPLPVQVITRMLGVPPAQHADFKRWSDAAVSNSPELGNAGFEALENAMTTLVVQRRQAPQDDLVSALLAALVDGELLSEEEIVDFCVILLLAGHETTTHLIGNAILCLDEHPEAREQVWANPSLLPSAIEEVLRFLSVVQRVVRRVTRDTEIGGQQIKAGYRVFNWVGSANRDEEYFPDPDIFDIQRSPNRHLGFSSGIHFCLGAPLARLEGRIALEAIIERFKDVQRAREVPLRPISSFFGYGVQRLPVRLEKR